MALLHLRSLQSFARETLPRAIELVRARGGRLGESVYVVADAGRPPGTELAVSLAREHERLSEREARRVVDARRQRRAEAGLPFIVSAVVPPATLLAAVASVPIRRRLRSWLKSLTPDLHARVVVLAGDRLAMEHVSLTGAGAFFREDPRCPSRQSPVGPVTEPRVTKS